MVPPFPRRGRGPPIRHPLILSGIGARNMGVPFGTAGRRRRHAHPVGRLPAGLQLLLHLGHVRRQGQVRQLLRDRRRAVRRHVPASRSGSHVQSFFVMDENFLLHRKRALRLLRTDARARQGLVALRLQLRQRARAYTIDQLVGLGISWVWMGLEGKDSQYAKLHGIDTRRTGPRTAVPRHPRARLHDHRPGEPHAREHRRTPSTTPCATTPTSTSSCSTRRSPARRCTPSSRPRAC